MTPPRPVDDSPSALPVFKKRKLVRACDYCRRKKSKFLLALNPEANLN